MIFCLPLNDLLGQLRIDPLLSLNIHNYKGRNSQVIRSFQELGVLI